MLRDLCHVQEKQSGPTKVTVRIPEDIRSLVAAECSIRMQVWSRHTSTC